MGDLDNPPRRRQRASGLLAAFACLATPLGAQPTQQPRLDDGERNVVERGNDLRRAQGQPTTAPNPALTATAPEFAAYLAG